MTDRTETATEVAELTRRLAEYAYQLPRENAEIKAICEAIMSLEKPSRVTHVACSFPEARVTHVACSFPGDMCEQCISERYA